MRLFWTFGSTVYNMYVHYGKNFTFHTDLDGCQLVKTKDPTKKYTYSLNSGHSSSNLSHAYFRVIFTRERSSKGLLFTLLFLLFLLLLG
jgi:hypothetical protein